jgi:hypothetical protein
MKGYLTTKGSGVVFRTNGHHHDASKANGTGGSVQHPTIIIYMGNVAYKVASAEE